MALFDRCSICDYTEREGSDFAGLLPGDSGKVAFYPNMTDFFCEVCIVEQQTNITDLTYSLDQTTAETNMSRNYRLFKRAKDIDTDEPSS